MIDFSGRHFEKAIIVWGVRWYVTYPILYRQLEEVRQERGVWVDPSTLNGLQILVGGLLCDRWHCSQTGNSQRTSGKHRKRVV
jgi:putative transposase